MTTEYALGIDPGKLGFVACLMRTGDQTPLLAPTQYTNDLDGFTRLWQDVASLLGEGDRLWIGVEATSAYDDNLLAWLTEQVRAPQPFQGLVLQLDPAQVAHFSGARPIRGKTDKADARRMARFTLTYADQLHKFEHDQESQAMLRMVNERGHLVQDRTALGNRLQTRLAVSFPELERVLGKPTSDLALTVLEKAPTARHARRLRTKTLAALRMKASRSRALGEERARELLKQVKRSVASACQDADADGILHLVAQLRMLDRRIEAIEKAFQVYAQSVITTAPEETTTPAKDEAGPRRPVARDIPEQLRLADTLPGIGLVGACTVVLRSRGVTRFTSAKALAAQLASCPDLVQTGTSKSTSHLTHRGDRNTRSTLYMLTLACIRIDPAMAFHKWRMQRKGLTPKQAVCACMNRLVHWLYAVVTSGVPYDGSRTLASAMKQHPKEWALYQAEMAEVAKAKAAKQPDMEVAV